VVAVLGKSRVAFAGLFAGLSALDAPGVWTGSPAILPGLFCSAPMATGALPAVSLSSSAAPNVVPLFDTLTFISIFENFPSAAENSASSS
jgi:hypothetical protein